MQPHREKPSKNCGTRFAAGELVADKEVPKEHNLRENQYRLLHCELRRALVGQILCISKERFARVHAQITQVPVSLPLYMSTTPQLSSTPPKEGQECCQHVPA